MSRLTLLFLAALLLPGCLGAAIHETTAGVSADAAEGEATPTGNRLLIRTGSLDLEAEEIETTADEIEALADELGGYVERRETGERHGSVTVRVPAGQLDSAIDRFAALGEETHRRLDARDVTDQVSDLEALRTNNIALRERLRALLKRAKTVKDVMAIESKLTELQREIDSQTGQLKNLKENVGLSRLLISLERPVVLGPLGYLGKGLWWGLKKLFVIRD